MFITVYENKLTMNVCNNFSKQENAVALKGKEMKSKPQDFGYIEGTVKNWFQSFSPLLAASVTPHYFPIICRTYSN